MISTNNNFDEKAFRYSLDWRFLIPISLNSKILYIGEGGEELKFFFSRLNISQFTYLDELNLQNSLKDLNTLFDIIVIPYGVSLKKGMFNLLREKLGSQGIVFINFSNRLWENHDKAFYFFSIKKEIEKNGFFILKSYGMFPDQYNSEYIFPLRPDILKFVIQHRYQYKLPMWILRILSTAFFTSIMTNFLPAYYIVAEMSHEK